MAYQFNGSSQYLSAALPVSAYPFTMAACISANGTATSGEIIGLGSSTFAAQELYISNNKLRIYSIFNADGAFTESSATLTANTWSHVAGVWSASNNRAGYVNGVKDGTNTSDRTFNSIIDNFRIAGFLYNNVSQGFFNGSIAEAAIWNAALTDAEIASLAAGFTPAQIRPQSLQFYAPLVRDLVDVRGGRAITNINGATVATHPRIIT